MESATACDRCLEDDGEVWINLVILMRLHNSLVFLEMVPLKSIC